MLHTHWAHCYNNQYAHSGYTYCISKNIQYTFTMSARTSGEHTLHQHTHTRRRSTASALISWVHTLHQHTHTSRRNTASALISCVHTLHQHKRSSKMFSVSTHHRCGCTTISTNTHDKSPKSDTSSAHLLYDKCKDSSQKYSTSALTSSVKIHYDQCNTEITKVQSQTHHWC